MKAYDYGFIGAIVATLLSTASGMLWLTGDGALTTQSELAPVAARPLSFAPEPSTARDLLHGSRMRVHGVVHDAAGLALAGVRVRPEGDIAPETLTDAHGGYELLLPLDPVFARPALRFLAEGYEDRHAILEASAVARMDVQLEPRRERTAVSGRVRGRAGEVVAGELVEIESDELEVVHTARTDARGHFFIPEVAVADDYELRIRPEGPYRQLWQFPLRATREGLDLELVLEPAPALAASSSLQVSGSRLQPPAQPLPH